MKRSADCILTTHTGSLPRPADLTVTLEALDTGIAPGPKAFDELGRIGLGKGKGRFVLESAFGVGTEGEVVVFRGSERRFVGVGVPITFEEVARKV
jgi:hypothetical protein